MRKIILEICGIFHAIFFGFQVFLTYLFYKNPNADQFGTRHITVIYAVWSCLAILFFAYISIFHSKDVFSTKLGKATLVLIALFYFIRAIEEITFFQVGVLKMFIPCLVVAILNVVLLFLPSPKERQKTEVEQALLNNEQIS